MRALRHLKPNRSFLERIVGDSSLPGKLRGLASEILLEIQKPVRKEPSQHEPPLPTPPASVPEAAATYELAGEIIACAALLASAVASLGVAWADQNLANTGRAAANHLCAQLNFPSRLVYFEGHWGFHYYMEKLGAKPADLLRSPFHAGDILVIPENTSNSFGPPPRFRMVGTVMNINLNGSLTTMSQPLGAGFCASVWGPLPYAVGPVPPERYLIARLIPSAGP